MGTERRQKQPRKPKTQVMPIGLGRKVPELWFSDKYAHVAVARIDRRHKYHMAMSVRVGSGVNWIRLCDGEEFAGRVEVGTREMVEQGLVCQICINQAEADIVARRLMLGAYRLTRGSVDSGGNDAA